MLWTIASILIILWLVGCLGFHIAGGVLHLLLVVAVVVVLFQFIGGRKLQ